MPRILTVSTRHLAILAFGMVVAVQAILVSRIAREGQTSDAALAAGALAFELLLAWGVARRVLAPRPVVRRAVARCAPSSDEMVVRLQAAIRAFDEARSALRECVAESRRVLRETSLEAPRELPRPPIASTVAEAIELAAAAARADASVGARLSPYAPVGTKGGTHASPAYAAAATTRRTTPSPRIFASRVDASHRAAGGRHGA